MSYDPYQQQNPQYPQSYPPPPPPAQGYPQPGQGYPQPNPMAQPQAYYAPQMAPMAPSTSGMAIASLICAFVFWPLGIVFGHIALNEIKKSNGTVGGHGLAMAGTILGYVFGGISVISICAWVFFVIIAASAASQNPSGFLGVLF